MTMPDEIPDDPPQYAVLTGHVGDTFNRQVSEALATGYELCGSLAITFDGRRTILAQAVIWKGTEKPSTEPRPTSAERFKAMT